MRCAVHEQAEAAGFCRNCGKAVCGECKRDVQGALYCEACLGALIARPAQPVGTGNPATAAVLGVVPGLGAVYNGEYLKGFVHLAIFAGMVAILSSGDAGNWEPLFGIFLAVFVVYMPIEAYRTAKAKMLGQPRTGPLDNLSADQPVGPVVLIGLGLVLLLNNLGVLNIGRLLHYGYPVALILLGVWLLRRRLQAPAREDKSGG